MAKKVFVLDTNILLFDPHAILQFDDNDIVIPLAVIKELDTFKTEQTERGRNARSSVRLLDQLRNGTSLSAGVPLPSGGTLRVDDSRGHRDHADQQVIAVAKYLNKRISISGPAIVVTKDINLRIQADVAGVTAQDYQAGKTDVREIYTGHREIEVEENLLLNFRSSTGFRLSENMENALNPNEYLLMRSNSKSQLTAMGRVSVDGQHIQPLIQVPRALGMVLPRNKEQHFLMDALLDASIDLVTVAGQSGTGKTLLAVAAGYYLTVVNHTYIKMLVTRPTVPMGQDLGFFPGDVEEKMLGWLSPIYDALHVIMRSTKVKGATIKQIQIGSADNQIQVEPLMLIRGRSIYRNYLFIDEAQNLTPHEVKTVITRAGEGTKVVLCGDLYQIDTPHLDSLSNGLAHTIGNFKTFSLAAHITLAKGVRSKLATYAAENL